MTSRKGWTPTRYEALGVTHKGGGMYRLPNGETVYDDGHKVRAPKGVERDLSPDPADVPGNDLLVVEGRSDVLSAAELGFSAVSIPSARKLRAGEAERVTRGRRRVLRHRRLRPDRSARTRANGRASSRPMARRSSWTSRRDRHDGFDVGDVLASALTIDAQDARGLARQFVDDRVAVAEHVYASEDDAAGPVSALRRPDPSRARPVRWAWTATGADRPARPRGRQNRRLAARARSRRGSRRSFRAGRWRATCSASRPTS